MNFSRSIRWLCVTAFITSLICGCGSLRWQDAGGKTLATIAQSVDSAMQGWATYVVIAKVPEDKQTSVRIQYGLYQSAFATAQTAYKAAVASGDQSGWDAASAALSAAQGDLFNLINLFNPSAHLIATK